MLFRKQHDDGNGTKKLLSGIPLEEPALLIPWDICENELVMMFQNYNISKVVDKVYYIKDITFLGEQHCNMGVELRDGIYKFSFSRDICDEGSSLCDKSIITPEGLYDYLKKSFETFQTALEKAFGKPTKREESITAPEFESCEWEICDKVRISHYVMDRFGLAEYLYIEHYGVKEVLKDKRGTKGDVPLRQNKTKGDVPCVLPSKHVLYRMRV